MAREIHYEDLALAIEPEGEETFRVRAINTPYGLTSAPFSLPFRRSDLEALIEESGVAVLDGRPGSDISRNLVKTGGRLFRALFHEAVREVYLLCKGRSESTPDHGLRIRLVLPIDTPDSALLQALPWELLYCEQTDDYLARSELTPVVRQLVIPWASSAFAGSPPERLRILIAVASPHGAEPLEDVDERVRIFNAWCKQEQVEVELLLNATLNGLREELRSRHYQVLHFIGHGNFDAETGAGALLFETPERRPHRVSGKLLAEALKGSRELRLVFLNACETGLLAWRPGQNPLLGTAAALVQRGVPAVIANQFPISDSAARVFSEAVYRSLARGSSLEAAVGDGRFAIHQEDTDSWEWVTPTLFTALSGADVFKPLCAPPRKRTPSPGEALSQAGRLLTEGTYEAVREKVESARAAGAESADLHYYLALALLRGRRPRSLKLEEIRPIVDTAARSLSLPDCAAHHSCLLAFLYKDFYLENYLVPPEPGYDALVTKAAALPLNPERLNELIRLVPWAKTVVDAVQKSAK
ncbi:MAG TPA: CHAT domain-containing protein [Thermoanaerobaculia bacterium]|nr:CHAT domain-containing protein [Thermoanaerobaculia bacterium]